MRDIVLSKLVFLLAIYTTSALGVKVETEADAKTSSQWMKEPSHVTIYPDFNHAVKNFDHQKYVFDQNSYESAV